MSRAILIIHKEVNTTKTKKYVLFQCWVHPDYKTLGEAINNPRLIREIDEFDTREEAEKVKESMPNDHFVYWIDEIE